MFLTFSRFRAARLDRVNTREELIAAASSTHATREAAEDYARREGRIILTPEGEVYEIAAEAPTGADLRAATYEDQYAEARRWLPAPSPRTV